jgi:hypothetical protein
VGFNIRTSTQAERQAPGELHRRSDLCDPDRLRRLEYLSDLLVRFGVTYANGQKVTSLDLMPAEDTTTRTTTSSALPVLRHMEHGANSGDLRWRSHHELWLWPLPPREVFDLVMEWPALEIPVATAPIDGAALREIVHRAQKIWD